MKKIDWKVKMQWNWYRAAFIGTAIAVLIAPTAGALIEVKSEDVANNPVVSAISSITFGPKTKVMIDGEVVALAKNETEAEEAYKAARLSYNADGVKLLDVDVTYALVDKDKDEKAIEGKKFYRQEELSEIILAELQKNGDKDKSVAYTMRIDDYTVTVESVKDVISVLEQAQGKYDTDDAFQVGLTLPDNHNVTMYEVDVQAKEKREQAVTEEDSTQGSESAATQTTEEASQQDATARVKDISQTDGIKYVGFSEKVQVMKTYVDKNQITSCEAAYEEITAENAEPTIYVVQPGDSLSGIAEKYSMSVEDVKALNPGIESDDNIYYDDRLTVSVPSSAVEILVQKQETYTEDYYADIVYEDDGEMYIGESEVIQEGQMGNHTVTDLVTYEGETECGREQLSETVHVAAVAQVVRRGTKSRPTYMYPCTNWPITSRFGYRWGRLHAGTDVGVPTGTTVRASRAGQVTVAGWLGGYGNCVMIDHGDGVVTVYGHLSEITVTVGEYVDQGERVALSGNTGRSTGPHLHFEIRINGTPVDPEPYLQGTAS
ncbi:MAG: M23 family metallopeptidase [Lachnospiraceae bacterium]|nr:M23 family metallopeptidase [Lachnospiraceae bacterium]